MTPARRETIKAIIGEIEDAEAVLERLVGKIHAAFSNADDAGDLGNQIAFLAEEARKEMVEAQLATRDAARRLVDAMRIGSP